MAIKNKLPSQLSEEELLSSLDKEEQESEDEIIDTSNSVLRFISHYSLLNGAYPVKKKTLYQVYKDWAEEPVSYMSFSLVMGKYIFEKNINLKPYFLINYSALKLTKKNLKIAASKTRDKSKSPRYRKHFENFINKYSLDKEEVWIPSYVLFYLYDKWTYKMNKNNPLGKKNFIKFCNLHFKKRRVTVNRTGWYLVSKEVHNHVTQTEIKELEEAQKRSEYTQKKYEKAFAKKRSKESSSSTPPESQDPV